MGDRCHANLTLFGLATRDAIEEVYQAIHFFAGPSVNSCRSQFEGSEQSLDMNEVNGGELDGSVLLAIQEAGLGYIWTWDGGSEFVAGLEFLDPRTQSTPATHDTLHGEIALTISDACNPETVAYMLADKTALEKLKHLPLCIAETAHETLECLAKHPELKGFAETTPAQAA